MNTLFDSVLASDVVYRSLTDDLNTGILSCGFMKKESKKRSQCDFTIGYYSCFLLLRGSGFYSDESGNRIPIKQGSLVQRLPNTVHTTEVNPDGKWLEFYISFGKPVFDYLLTLGLLQPDPPVFSVKCTEDMIRSFTLFLKKLKEADESLLPSLLFGAQELVVYLHSYTHQIKTPAEKAVYCACEMLNSHFDKPLSLVNLAQTVNMGYESFRKTFKEITGVSLSQYRIEKKIKYAQLLLLSGYSIKEVALRCGYEDCQAFSKQFKKTTNFSPGYFIKRDCL